MSAGSLQGWQSWKWENKERRVESERKDLVRTERRPGILEVTVNGRTAPIFQESMRSEDEESNLEGKHSCALKRKQTTDVQSWYAQKGGPRGVYAEGRICVRRYVHFFQKGRTSRTWTSEDIGAGLPISHQVE